MKQRMIAATSLFLIGVGLSPLYAGSASGIVSDHQLYKLGLPLNGVVKTVSVQPGARVSKGDELLKIDCSRYDLQKQQARASAKSVSVNATQAKLELERATEMYDQDLIADIEMVEASDRYAESHAVYQAALAKSKLASLNQSYCALKSPVDGLVLFINANAGATVAGEFEVNTLIGIQASAYPTVELTLPIGESLFVGQAVKIVTEKQSFSAFVGEVNQQGDRLVARIVTADGESLRGYQSVQVDY